MERLGFATLDHERALRNGLSRGDLRPGQDAGAGRRDREAPPRASRPRAGHARRAGRAGGARRRVSPGRGARARPLRGGAPPRRRRPVAGRVLVVCAGTADLPVAEEALVTARTHGQPRRTGRRRGRRRPAPPARAPRTTARGARRGGGRRARGRAAERGRRARGPAAHRGAHQRGLRRALSTASRRCWRCSTRAPRGSPWSTSTTVSVRATPRTSSTGDRARETATLAYFDCVSGIARRHDAGRAGLRRLAGGRAAGGSRAGCGSRASRSP